MRGSFRYPCVPQTSLAVAKMVRGKRKHRVRRRCSVREPLTEELLNELLSSPDPNSFLLSANPSRRSLAEYLQQLLDEKGLERSKVVREAGLNDTFGYQIFKGTRKASRDKVLQLAFAMQLGLRETDRLLQAAGANELLLQKSTRCHYYLRSTEGLYPSKGQRRTVSFRGRNHLLNASQR